MAAEVLAAELKLDLYHIDLSQVVSKYIGETEANLRRVFDAAEENGAILLFDEADSLFGVRSQVKDSHDRYANIEVSYLLQRMESYRGLAVLTTNMRQGIDQAFLRRIRFAVEFPFPDAAHRAAIWRGVFPAATRTEGLDFERLAHLRLAGGSIRNIALNAAFLAAETGEPVRMSHLRRAAQAEYAKLERRLTPTEAEAWPANDAELAADRVRRMGVDGARASLSQADAGQGAVGGAPARARRPSPSGRCPRRPASAASPPGSPAAAPAATASACARARLRAVPEPPKKIEVASARHAPRTGEAQSPTPTPSACVRPSPAKPVAVREVSAVRVQTQMRVSSPSDPAEQEASAVGKTIMRMPNPDDARAPAPAVSHRDTGVAQREAAAGAGHGHADPQVMEKLRSSSSSGSPLPHDMRTFMEPRFKADFSGVRIHTDEHAAHLAAQLGARAFTIGRDIYFAKGEFRPDRPEGWELVAHELTHTIQQGGAAHAPVAPPQAPAPAKPAAPAAQPAKAPASPSTAAGGARPAASARGDAKPPAAVAAPAPPRAAAPARPPATLAKPAPELTKPKPAAPAAAKPRAPGHRDGELTVKRPVYDGPLPVQVGPRPTPPNPKIAPPAPRSAPKRPVAPAAAAAHAPAPASAPAPAAAHKAAPAASHAAAAHPHTSASAASHGSAPAAAHTPSKAPAHTPAPTRSTSAPVATPTPAPTRAPAAPSSPQVTQKTAPSIQRLGISDVLDWIASHANDVPGFRMLTIILGVNPINMSPVDRSAANVMRAIIEFLPGGAHHHPGAGQRRGVRQGRRLGQRSARHVSP